MRCSAPVLLRRGISRPDWRHGWPAQRFLTPFGTHAVQCSRDNRGQVSGQRDKQSPVAFTRLEIVSFADARLRRYALPIAATPICANSISTSSGRPLTATAPTTLPPTITGTPPPQPM
jgi:hypothetical protein